MSTDDIIPEDFDLDDARHAASTTPVEDEDTCPHCGSIQVMSRVEGKDKHGGTPTSRQQEQIEYDEPYFCDNCRERFEEPA
jgi:hypothetical protein